MPSPHDLSFELDFGATLRGFNTGQRLFDRYTLKEILGRGGMGIVWRAFDELLERDVALKFLPELVSFDETAIADLKREAKKSQELRHHHIVQVYDFVSNKQNVCISMEYVDGPTLSALKARKEQGFLEVDEIRKWIEQLCEALAYAHQRARVVHRDLKPANLMVNSKDELKVTDFGIARSVSDSVSMLTMARGTSGTLVYMSPQQLGGQRASHLDDIYSVGASMYELLTSKPPFYSGDVTDQIKNVSPVSMPKRREDLEIAGSPIPKEWEETVAACLAKDPTLRPQSAGEIAKRLGLATPWYQPLSIPARGLEKREPIAQQPIGAKAYRKFVIAGAIAISLAAVGFAGWWFGIEQPRRQAERARLMAEQKGKEQKNKEEADRQAKLAEQQRLETERQAAANARGAVLINTEPQGATVTLGDENQKSPATFNQVKVGTLPLKIIMEGYEPTEQQVEVKEGQISNPGVIKLVRSTGTVQIDTTPEGIEFDLEDVEGKHHAGKTPATLSDLVAGQSKITYKPEKAGTHTESIAVIAHQTLPVSWKQPQRFTILGQVNRPGSYEMPESSPDGIDLLETVAMAGGYTRIAAPERTTVRRHNASGDQIFKVNAKRFTEASGGGFLIEPGDTITVGESIF